MIEIKKAPLIWNEDMSLIPTAIGSQVLFRYKENYKNVNDPFYVVLLLTDNKYQFKEWISGDYLADKMGRDLNKLFDGFIIL